MLETIAQIEYIAGQRPSGEHLHKYRLGNRIYYIPGPARFQSCHRNWSVNIEFEQLQQRIIAEHTQRPLRIAAK